MRILQLCNKMPYPPHDGGSIAILNLTHSFAKLGHDVTLLCMATSKHNHSDREVSEAKLKTNLHSVKVDTDIKWIPMIMNLLFSKDPYIVKRFISDNFRATLIQILKDQSFDIIQLEGTYLLPYLETIRSHSKAVVALRSHNIEHKIWEGISKITGNPFKKIYLQNLSKRLKRFEQKYINRYDLLVPITGIDNEAFYVMGNRKPAMVCHSGYDTENLPEVNPTGMNSSLFFLGSLDWIPNQQGLSWFALKVIPLLSRQHPNLVFYVAGRNAPRSILNKLTHSSIIFCGEVPDARDYMGSKGIMIVPLFSGSGMRIKIIEAMAMGKPVVATTKAAEGIGITPDENILLADSTEDYVRQTARLLNNDELYRRISKNAVNFIRNNYNNLQITSALADFYLKYKP